MYEAKKEGFLTQCLVSDVQAAAFRNNGWEVSPVEKAESKDGSDELKGLRAQADALEIKYHPNTGAEKLREKIAEAEAAKFAAAQQQ